MAAGRWARWGIRLGAVTLAFFLWLYAVTEHVYTMETTARLHVHDPVAPARGGGGVLVATSVPEEIAIRVTGRGKDLLRLERESFALHLRPEGAAGTTRSYRLAGDMIQARDGVDVVVERIVAPQEIDITLDRRGQRLVAVHPRIGLAVAPAYVLVGDMSIDPRQVQISGPSAQIRMVQHIDTDTLSLPDVQDDVDVYLPLVSPEGVRGRLVPARVRLRANIQLLAQDDLLQVPVAIRHGAAARYRVEPARVRVKVKGGIEVIARIDPEQNVGLYVDALDYQGEPLAIRYDKERLFEILEVAPTHVYLIER
jgi:YbbR domain-containing protein